MFDSRSAFLLAKLLFQQLLDHRHVDVEQRHQRARVRNVLHQNAFARIAEVFVAHLCKRNAQEVHIVARELRIERPAGIVEQIAARPHLANIPRVSLRVHRDHQVVIERARGVAVSC